MMTVKELIRELSELPLHLPVKARNETGEFKCTAVPIVAKIASDPPHCSNLENCILIEGNHE